MLVDQQVELVYNIIFKGNIMTCRGYDPKTVKVTKLMKIAAAHIVDKHARGRLTRSYVQVLEEQSRDRGARTKK